jgi:hypothetical protein
MDSPIALLPPTALGPYIRSMEPSHLLLAQSLSLSALVAATGAYAGIVRRRGEVRIGLRATVDASLAAVDRIDRSMALTRLDRTFIRSTVRRKERDSTSRWL